MTDYSSSSDDEEKKAKLKSAAWPTWSRKSRPTKSDTGTRPTVKQSLSIFDDCAEQSDYRNVDTTPELKAFVAKKLASWLDSSLKEVDRGIQGVGISGTAQTPDDDFKLFSTSKPGPSVEKPRPAKKQQRPPSSSDSDSSEEYAKLSSAAVSCEQVIQRRWPEMPQNHQVTTNLSPTNKLSSRTSNDEATRLVSCDQERESDCEKPKGTCDAHASSNAELEDHGRENKKRKKKRKKRELEVNSENLELISEGRRKHASQKHASQVKKQKLENLKVDSEIGSESPVEPSEQIVKKKKGKCGQAVSTKSNPQNESELSAR